MDFANIEKKWQQNWEKAGLFAAEPAAEPEKNFYITVAFPYPSGAMHVGHMRTYTVPDVIARFRRMQGHHVLFPMAWHVTGTPIVGAVNRLKEKEKKQLDVLKEVFKVSAADLKKLETPIGFARYFIENHYKAGMKGLGFSIDWRREFTTHDPHYNKFVEWQYLALKKKGLVKKGLHPVKWCTKSQDPVTAHDLLEGENADITEFTLIKFRLDKKILPAATLRPETVFGVTNLWLNPATPLVLATAGTEEWILSREAVRKLELQGTSITVKKEINPTELIGKTATNPVTKKTVPILPASFVDPDTGSGVVMSVPAHAPFDYVALEELKRDSRQMKKYLLRGQDIESITPIGLITTDGLPDQPAVEFIRQQKVQSEREKIQDITKDIYKKEFHAGVLNRNCGKYAGKKVSEAKKLLVADFSAAGLAGEMLDFSEPVRCRDGGKVVVAKKDSWFLEYGNRKWKAAARKALAQTTIIPDYLKSEYGHAIEWLEDWPCIRHYGLGTHLPWDRKFIIEPLSDSTLYMSFYTISHLLQKYRPEQLMPELFDLIFLDAGDAKAVAKKTGIPGNGLRQLKTSFERWYPVDWRCSAHELIQNHLTFFLFHHAALFPENHWPRGIATWGVGLLEGGKMSSSKGNVVLATEAIREYGADACRLFLMSSVEPWQDFDWRAKEMDSCRKQIGHFYQKVMSLNRRGETRRDRLIDQWLASETQKIIRQTTEALEAFQTRKATLSAFFRMNDMLRWYEKRAETMNRELLQRVLLDWVRLMAPFIPHTCEELWQQLGNDGFVSTAPWPEAHPELINERVGMMENLITQTADDIAHILRLVGKKPKKILISPAPAWKHTAYNLILKSVKDPKQMIAELMKNPEIRKQGQHAVKFAENLRKDLGSLQEILTSEEELTALKDATPFFGKEFNCPVAVIPAAESRSEKALKAQPGRPGIEVET